MPEIPTLVILELVILPLHHLDEHIHVHGSDLLLEEPKVELVTYNKYCYSEVNGEC